MESMDERTEELRDIFLSASDDATVTERQEQGRGSLTEDERRTDERIEAVVGRMREAYRFRTDLSDEALRSVVRGFYAGDDDAAIADELGVEETTVFRARLDLHLVRESDTEAPFDVDALRDLVDEGVDAETAADRLDADEETVDRCRAALATEREARRASHRYRSEFEDALPDAVISVRHTTEVREDGLEEATEGMETDVSL